MKINQIRYQDAINFYDVESGSCVATLFDGQDSIIFDELAYSPALLDDSIGPHFVEESFKEMGLDAITARMIDSCRTPDINL